MSDKNSKVLERLAFAAGLKVEDLREAIISLAPEPKAEVSDLKSRLSHVMKEVYSPSPLSFAAGIKVEDLKAAIVSLSKGSNASNEGIAFPIEGEFNFTISSGDTMADFMEQLKEQIGVPSRLLGLPSPLSVDTERISRETAVFKAIDFISFGWNWTKKFTTYNVNAKKRTVVCLIRNTVDNKIVSKGIAKCNPDDCFNEYIGKAIALSRATDTPVPEYLLDVPQPDQNDVQRGDILKFEPYPHEYTVLDPDEPTHNLSYIFNGKHELASANFKNKSDLMSYKIINDTGRY